MTITLDGNVIVAAFASRGLCNSVFELCLDRFHIVINEFILDEVRKALINKIKMPINQVNIIIDFLKDFCDIITHDKPAVRVCRDLDDDNILSLAKASKSSMIITGDKDLLILKKYKNIKILTPRDFWDEVRKIK
ncbi:MAG: putative toxin-antitoxin system toxin component, PIN family [Spirochaetia bacterium]|nr:putative toxin-antitoxin system toxin component, PIN family [Spirochaetia bacterium]